MERTSSKRVLIETSSYEQDLSLQQHPHPQQVDMSRSSTLTSGLQQPPLGGQADLQGGQQPDPPFPPPPPPPQQTDYHINQPPNHQVPLGTSQVPPGTQGHSGQLDPLSSMANGTPAPHQPPMASTTDRMGHQAPHPPPSLAHHSVGQQIGNGYHGTQVVGYEGNGQPAKLQPEQSLNVSDLSQTTSVGARFIMDHV